MRDGSNLVITTADGQTITLADFFAPSGEPSSQLFLAEGEDQQLVWVDISSSANGAIEATYLPQSEYGVFDLATQDGGEGYLGAALIAGGIASVGAIAIDSNSGSSSDDDDDDNGTPPEDDAPATPTEVNVADDGSAVTGSAEPGTTVTVTDGDGNELGSVEAGEDGSFEVPLDPPLTNGEDVDVVASDGDGNQSESVSATAPDTTAPETPTISD
ncbi:MAG: hypothetical protein CMN25_15065, partial [Salinicola sp.]|nr:hypothetical protein [Salinicola sp.]